MKAELDRLLDDIFRERGKSGTTECRDAYAFDALRSMAERSRALHLGGQPETGPRRQPAPQHLALLRLDIAALWRGYVHGDELCEITGLGPIPVATATRFRWHVDRAPTLAAAIDAAGLRMLDLMNDGHPDAAAEAVIAASGWGQLGT